MKQRVATTLTAALVAAAITTTACGPSARDGNAPATPTPTGSGTPEPTPTATPTPEATLRFVAVGDTGTGDEAAHLVASAIGEKCAAEGCAFIALLGDNIYPAGVTSTTDSGWERVAPYETLGIPIWAVLGNHDYGSNGDAFDRPDYQIAYGETHPLWRMPARHYGFADENALFVVLDTNLAIFDKDDTVAVQTAFAGATLGEADGRWRFSLGHHPYLSNGNHGDAGSYANHPPGSLGSGKHVKSLYENAVCGKVDVMLTAHDHSRQVLPGNEACPTLNVVSGAGGGTGTLVGTHPFLYQSPTNGFAYFVVTPSRLRLEMVDVSGTVDYVLELER